MIDTNDIIWETVKWGMKQTSKPNEKAIYWLPENIKSVYRKNKLGYRGDDFFEKKNFVFAGCSHTYGQGIIEEGIWGNQVSRQLGVESHNISGVGKSVQWIVSSLFDYFKLFGAPKTVMCLFPDFTRVELISNTKHMIGKHWDHKSGTIKYAANAIDNKYGKISKAPHIAEEIIPAEFAILISLEYIKMLEMYCEARGIKLLWGTWDITQQDYIIKNKSSLIFKNFIELDNDNWHVREEDDFYVRYHEFKQPHKGPCTTFTDCHAELRDLYGKNFDLAFDVNPNKNKKQNGHYGIHYHTHWAESFLKELA